MPSMPIQFDLLLVCEVESEPRGACSLCDSVLQKGISATIHFGRIKAW
jgi:hypothetical protein